MKILLSEIKTLLRLNTPGLSGGIGNIYVVQSTFLLFQLMHTIIGAIVDDFIIECISLE